MCLTCAGEFASDCIKEDGSAGLSEEDSGKNGDETVLSYAWVQLDQAESHMIEMCRVWQCDSGNSRMGRVWHCDSGNSSKCLQKVPQGHHVDLFFLQGRQKGKDSPDQRVIH